MNVAETLRAAPTLVGEQVTVQGTLNVKGLGRKVLISLTDEDSDPEQVFLKLSIIPLRTERLFTPLIFRFGYPYPAELFLQYRAVVRGVIETHQDQFVLNPTAAQIEVATNPIAALVLKAPAYFVSGELKDVLSTSGKTYQTTRFEYHLILKPEPILPVVTISVSEAFHRLAELRDHYIRLKGFIHSYVPPFQPPDELEQGTDAYLITVTEHANKFRGFCIRPAPYDPDANPRLLDPQSAFIDQRGLALLLEETVPYRIPIAYTQQIYVVGKLQESGLSDLPVAISDVQSILMRDRIW
jgi:hypothetical protein